MDYKSDEIESSFQIAKDVEVHFSCSTMFKGEYFVFGGRENQSSVRSKFSYFFPFYAIIFQADLFRSVRSKRALSGNLKR